MPEAIHRRFAQEIEVAINDADEDLHSRLENGMVPILASLRLEDACAFDDEALPKLLFFVQSVTADTRAFDYCRDVDASGGFVLIRHQTQINPVVVRGLVDGRFISTLEGQRLHDIVRTYRGRTIDMDAQWKGVGQGRRPDTRLRVVLIWNERRKDYMALVTNLGRDLSPPSDIYQIYRLRWQVELLFKEWKSYCNLHAFGTTKAPLAEGLIWAALAACIL